MNHLKKNSGLSLVELMIVMSIAAILSYMGFASYQNSFRKSRNSRRQSDLEMIRGALEIYRADSDYYFTAGVYGTEGYVSLLNTLDSGNYINTRPQDPQSPALGYYYNPSSTTYILCAFLEATTTNSCPAGSTVSCGTQNCNYGVSNP